eukprot:5258443-Pyramimonas_sp.AAC.1
MAYTWPTDSLLMADALRALSHTHGAAMPHRAHSQGSACPSPTLVRPKTAQHISHGLRMAHRWNAHATPMAYPKPFEQLTWQAHCPSMA